MIEQVEAIEPPVLLWVNTSTKFSYYCWSSRYRFTGTWQRARQRIEAGHQSKHSLSISPAKSAELRILLQQFNCADDTFSCMRESSYESNEIEWIQLMQMQQGGDENLTLQRWCPLVFTRTNHKTCRRAAPQLQIRRVFNLWILIRRAVWWSMPCCGLNVTCEINRWIDRSIWFEEYSPVWFEASSIDRFYICVC